MQGGQKLTAPAAGVCLLLDMLPSGPYLRNVSDGLHLQWFRAAFLRKKSIQICFTVTVPTVKFCGKINPGLNSLFSLAKPFLSAYASLVKLLVFVLWSYWQNQKGNLLLDDGRRFRSASYNQRKIMQQCCRWTCSVILVIRPLWNTWSG